MSAIHTHHGNHHGNSTPVKLKETGLASKLAGMGMSPQQIETILAQINGTKPPAAPQPAPPPAPPAPPQPSSTNANQAALFQMQAQDAQTRMLQYEAQAYYQGMSQMEAVAVAQVTPLYNASSSWGAWGAIYQNSTY